MSTPGAEVNEYRKVVRGRGFAEADRGAQVYSIVLNDKLARQMFPNQEAIGKHVLRGPNGEWFTVIGVCADVHNRGPARDAEPEYYVVRKAVADLKGWKVVGFPAWFIWKTVYMLKLPTWAARLRVVLDWTVELFFERDVSELTVDGERAV